MKTYPRVLSFWTAQVGDPIRIRPSYPNKNLRGWFGVVSEKSQHRNGYGIVLKVRLLGHNKVVLLRVPCEHIELLSLSQTEE
jgi:hypothetical protein